MYCPSCKTEYREGFSKCTDCGADLVRDLGALADPIASGFAELIWAGSNPHKLAAVKNLLTDAGIQFSVKGPESHILFASVLPTVQLYVISSDLVRARMLIDERFDESDDEFESTNDDSRSNGESDDVSKDSDEDSGAPSDLPEFVSEDWNPDAATCSVWRGGDGEFAENLRVSLLENGIGSCVVSTDSLTQLMIYPSDESRAREIIREVVDGAPPS